MEDSKELHSASHGSRVPGCHPTAWLQVLELPRQTWTERDQLRWWVWVPTASRCPPAADAETVRRHPSSSVLQAEDPAPTLGRGTAEWLGGCHVLPAEQEHPSSPEGKRLPESCALHRLCGAYSAECFRLKAAPCGPVAGEQLCKTPSPTCDTVTSYLLRGCTPQTSQPEATSGVANASGFSCAHTTLQKKLDTSRISHTLRLTQKRLISNTNSFQKTKFNLKRRKNKSN